MTARNKSGGVIIAGKNLLFAELIIIILVFALCAAGCVTLFADAYTDGNRSRDLTNAVITAQNAAECFKAAGGDIAETEKLLGQSENSDLRLEIYAEEAEGVITARIVIIKDAEIIYELTTGVAL